LFTGLIEDIGTVDKLIKGQKSAQIFINANKVMDDLKIGDSINTNGVCLTVVKFSRNQFAVDVMPETMNKSNLSELVSGERLNLERALRVGDRFGGHMVSGHVDGTGIIQSFAEEDNATWVTIEAGPEILKYIISKGSVALDGISLTVAHVDTKSFKVSMIPLTKKTTTLLDKSVGSAINIECDMVGKYIERLTSFKDISATESAIDMAFLKNNGFA
jgi:riboflavin synthase